MSMPFSRPGAIDLSALKRPATPPSGQRPSGGTGVYAIQLDDQNIQAVLEASMTAPVVVVVYSPSQMPQSAQLAADLETVALEFEGRFLLGKLDVDLAPELAQAMQIPSVPLVMVVLQGRPAPLLQDTPPLAELRTIMAQVLQQMASQGLTGRHQPLAAPAAADQPAAGAADEVTDPRYAPAEDAMLSGDYATAVAEYEKLINESPGDTEAVIGLARAKLIARTADVDLTTARAAAAGDPDDVDAHVLVADLDLLGGHVDDCFNRLIEVVRRTAGAERDRVRVHLIELFTVVGDDPRVLKARQNLANALY
jgi:putative thioredoxin